MNSIFSDKLISSTKCYKNKEGKKVSGTMLSILSGTEIMIISELETFRNYMYSIDDLVELMNISKPVIRASLKKLEEFNIINWTIKFFKRGQKPTIMYFYNRKYEQKYKNIH